MTPSRRWRQGCWPTHPSSVLHSPASRWALRRSPVTPRPEVRAQHKLARATARFKTAMRLGDLLKRDPLGDAWPYGAFANRPKSRPKSSRNQAGMACSHDIDRVKPSTLAARQPPPHIQARNRCQEGEHAMLGLHARSVAVGSGPRVHPASASPSGPSLLQIGDGLRDECVGRHRFAEATPWLELVGRGAVALDEFARVAEHVLKSVLVVA